MIPVSFADDWIAAWNAHSLPAILAHYADDVTYSSPFIASLLGITSNSFTGKTMLQTYIARGLAAYPALHFELLGVFYGHDSAVLQYRSVNSLIAAETFCFNQAGKISRVLAHYSSGS